jgi:hypothetical protein
MDKIMKFRELLADEIKSHDHAITLAEGTLELVDEPITKLSVVQLIDHHKLLRIQAVQRLHKFTDLMGID